MRTECALLSVLSLPLSVDSLLRQSLWSAYVFGSTLTHDQGLMNVPGTFLPSVAQHLQQPKEKGFSELTFGRLWSITKMKAWLWKEKCVLVVSLLSPPILFLPSRTSAHGTVPPSSRVGLPSYENIFSTHKRGSFRLFQIQVS